ncbi:Trp biosynthesis-associated membrane protein [Arthrobacter cavernae]|uniref:Trp biosynthesis-associated membrane protein n=1 Tax=Arthrobacter cavernae TaxID=2817681 RepID=A0A939HH77_9MICC|nr:Trp biosynthesis-associated membrane protein [Arthrobacter cavernae]MBO1267821.1 Trp biosynthesis-associated membrane protein [Arthrobacter cavernae]
MSTAIPAGSPTPASSAVRPPRWARKSTLVLVTVLLALAVFGTTTQSWIEVRLDPAGASSSDLHVQGSKAATAVTALALVALAGGLAASIAGRFSRWIIAVIIALSAAGIIAAAATVLAAPLAAAQGSIAAATGISGGQAAATATVFPLLAVVAASLLAVCAMVLPPAGRHWKTRTKYDVAARARQAGTGPVDEIDSWDSLSRGEDPT